MVSGSLNYSSSGGEFGFRLPSSGSPDGIKLGLGYRLVVLLAAAVLVFGICLLWGAVNGWKVTTAMLIVMGISFTAFVGISEQFRFRIFEGGRRRRTFANIYAEDDVVRLDRVRIGKAKSDQGGLDEAPRSPSSFYLAGTKRVLDIGVASTALLLSLPLFAALAVLVKVHSKGPVFERVEAFAPDGSEIRFARFNTAHPADRGRKVDYYWRRDVERTPVNDFLIRSGLDRLPALLAVLRGDLALVGPDIRTFRAEKAASPQLRPGFTGLVRLAGNAHGLGIGESLDDFYERNVSLRLDLRIVAKSLRLMIAAIL